MSSPFQLRGFTAKYRGVCGDCGREFEAGEQIAYDSSRDIVHADADDCITTPGRPGTNPCQKCFLVHAGDCF